MTASRFGEVIERLAREGRSLTEIVEQLRKERRWANVDERTVSHYAQQHGIEIQDTSIPSVSSAADGEREADREVGHPEPTAVILRPIEAPVWPPPPPIPTPSRVWMERWGREFARFFEENQAEYGWRDPWDMITCMYLHLKSFPEIRQAFLAVLDRSIQWKERVQEWAQWARDSGKAYLERRAAEHLRELDVKWGERIRALQEALAASRRAEETARQTIADRSVKLATAWAERVALREEISKLREERDSLSEKNQNLTEALDFVTRELLGRGGTPPTSRALFALLQRAWDWHYQELWKQIEATASALNPTSPQRRHNVEGGQ